MLALNEITGEQVNVKRRKLGQYGRIITICRKRVTEHHRISSDFKKPRADDASGSVRKKT